MSGRLPRRKWPWHLAGVLGVSMVLLGAAVILFLRSEAGSPLLRRLVVRRLESLTGGRVELGGVSVSWFSLRVTLNDLVIHGREPAGSEPFLAADKVQAALRVDSFWGRKVSLDELTVDRPRVHLRVDQNGSNNVPRPRTAGISSFGSEKLFELGARRVALNNGWVLYNDVRKPLAMEGTGLYFGLVAGGPLLYLGTLEWQSFQFTAKRFLPMTAGISARFSLSREGLVVEQALVNLGRSRVDLQAQMQDFSSPQWTFRYRGWFNLLDYREIMRSPHAPAGRADVHGQGSWAAGQLRSTGQFAAQDITANYYPIFHAAGLTSRGGFRLNNQGVDLPDFTAEAFQGAVHGQVTLRFEGVRFRALTHLQNIRLASVLPAVSHHGFPVDQLHWDALVSGNTVETWTGAFQHFEVSGQVEWSAPGVVAAAHLPVNGHWDFSYRYDPQILTIKSGSLETPSTHASVAGVFQRRDTALDVHFETAALESYADFINAIRGVDAHSAGALPVFAGSGRWEGKVTGPAGAPTFAGHARGEGVRYDGLLFDLLEGDTSYSPQQLMIAHGSARRGAMDVGIDATVALTQWVFLPDNAWSADVNLEATPLEEVQQLVGTSYPVRGQVQGQFHGRGTRAEPTVTGLFDMAAAQAYGVSFQRLRGQISATPNQVRIADAELRLFPAGSDTRGVGIVTGSAGYDFAQHTISADLVGASLQLSKFEKLSFPRFAVDGRVSFRLKASGSLTAPEGEGTFRVVDLQVGQAVIGSFDGALTSDGRTAHLELRSAMPSGEISGGYTLGLSDPYPLNGQIQIKNIDLDPMLLTGLELGAIHGHGKADGVIALTGDLQHPERIVLDANFSRLLFSYASVQLQNAGPVHFRSSRESLIIDQAAFRGQDTDIEFKGQVGLLGHRALNLQLNGALDLRLLSGYVSGLTTGGKAQINGSFQGFLDRPRINGRIHVENAFARVADFPTGLEAMKGDLVFDDTRLFFNEVTAEAGGGTLHLSGSVNYAERPLRYDISARSDKTRIRYPEGMSWLAGGNLRLVGTKNAAVLSGKVAVERLTLSQGLEVAGTLVVEKQAIYGRPTSSPFLRNLQFEIEAVSTPDTRMQWPGAELAAEADLFVRGTWEHPIILGHIHVLFGDLLFRGNRYRVARGDINFANPFRLDPVVNVEATTTIQQYEITLNFSGPASKLTLAYRSDPPLPSTDIVTLLALGQTTGVHGGAATQTTGLGASALLTEAVSSQVGGRLERLFGITSLRVDPALTTVGSPTGQTGAARVTVQQRVTPNLTVTYVSNVGSTQQQVIQMEYNLSRAISIVALRDYNGTFGIDVKIKKRFP